MAKRLAENLWQLDIPLVGSPLKNLNSYLITGERNLLVDTGFYRDSCREAMYAQLRDVGVDLARTDLFLTHLHSDHTGLSKELHRPGCKVMISTADSQELLARGTDEFWRQRNENYIRDGFSRREMDELWGTNPARETEEELFRDHTCVEEGAVLAYGGYRFECIATPGHTPGHLCLYDREREVFLSGDHVLFHISPNICRWESMPDALGSYLKSLCKVRDYPVELLLPAHRAESGRLRTRVDELLSHHQRRLEETEAALRARPGMTAYETAGAMRWKIRCRGWEDFPLIQKFFAVGEALAHLDHLERLGRVRRKEDNGRVVWYAV